MSYRFDSASWNNRLLSVPPKVWVIVIAIAAVITTLSLVQLPNLLHGPHILRICSIPSTIQSLSTTKNHVSLMRNDHKTARLILNTTVSGGDLVLSADSRLMTRAILSCVFPMYNSEFLYCPAVLLQSLSSSWSTIRTFSERFFWILLRSA